MRWSNHCIFKLVIYAAILTLSFPSIVFFPKNGFALSIQEETEMGREFVFQIRRHFELLDDAFVNQFFSELGHYLIQPLETKPFPFNFYIIKDKTMNAFAAPGGHVFFYSGLIVSMDRVDELAAILCHEIGHISARHMSRRIEQNKKIGLITLAGVLAGALVGGEAAGPLLMGSMAGGIQARLHYSRNDERQADHLGYKYMTEMEFDPRGMASTLKKITNRHYSGSHETPVYLLTHPTGPERMSNLDSMLSNYTPPPEPSKRVTMFRKLFPLFQTVVRAKCMDPDIAERYFKQQLDEKDHTMASHFGLGLVYIEKQEYEKAVFEIKAAKKIDPEFVPVLTNLGRAYQLKDDDKKAISVLENALALAYEDKIIPYLLGVSYENLEQYEKAIRYFERLAAFEPVKEDVYYHLGMVYGKLKNLLLAHYNLGIYYKRINEINKARFHFQKAFEFSADDPKIRKKIENERQAFPQQPHQKK